MLKKPVYPAKRLFYAWILWHWWGMHTTVNERLRLAYKLWTVERLKSTNRCLAWIRWALSIDKDHQNELSKQLYAQQKNIIDLILRYDRNMSNAGPFNCWKGAQWLGLKQPRTIA